MADAETEQQTDTPAEDRVERLAKTAGMAWAELSARLDQVEAELESANSDDAIRLGLADTRRLHAYADVMGAMSELGVHIDTGEVTLAAESVCRAIRRIADADL